MLCYVWAHARTTAALLQAQRGVSAEAEAEAHPAAGTFGLQAHPLVQWMLQAEPCLQSAPPTS